jgi:AraC-like DNA-binding protein
MSCYRLLLGEPHWVGFTKQPRNFVHRHSFYEPCLVTAGRGEFDHGDRHYKLGPGDLFIGDVGVFHEITSLKTRDLELLFASFAVTEVKSDATINATEDRIIRNFLRNHAAWKPKQHHLEAHFRLLLEAKKNEHLPHQGFFIRETMRVLVLQIMAALNTETQRDVSADGKFQTALDRVARAIDSRLHEPIWVGDIARSSGLSERSLRRLCRQRLNRTVAQEIQERKMQRAATLLALPEFSVAEAARRVGIENAAQFSRLFRKILGVPPREYRAARIPAASGDVRFTKIGGVAMKTEFREKQK